MKKKVAKGQPDNREKLAGAAQHKFNRKGEI